MQVEFVEADGLDDGERPASPLLVFEGGKPFGRRGQTAGGADQSGASPEPTQWQSRPISPAAKGKTLGRSSRPRVRKASPHPAGGRRRRKGLRRQGQRDRRRRRLYRGARRRSGVKTLRLDWAGYSADQAASAALGVRLAAYRFDRYRTKEKAEKKPTIETVEIAVDDVAAAKKADAPLAALADAVIFTRDLVSEPANILHPEEIRQAASMSAGEHGAERRNPWRQGDDQAGHGLALGRRPGQRAREPAGGDPMEGRGRPERPSRIAFVGKGVCFDSGGISTQARPMAWRT